MENVIENPLLAPRIYGDTPAFMAVPYMRDIANAKADVVIFGMPFDGIATLRGGATRLGPSGIRKMSMLYGGYNLDWGFDVFEHLSVVDRGDIDVMMGDTPESYRRLEAAIAEIRASGAVPLMMGGDHGVTYPAVKAVSESLRRPLGLVVFDTHLDLSNEYRRDRLTRASPLKRICELPGVDPTRVAVIGAKGPRNLPEWKPTADELGIRIFPIGEVEARGIGEVTEEAYGIAAPDGEPPYVSLDIDAIDAAFAPATNSIEVGGLTSREIITGVRIAVEKGIVGFDLVEVAPEWDNPTGSTCALAARLIAETLATLAAPKARRVRAWDHAAPTG